MEKLSPLSWGQNVFCRERTDLKKKEMREVQSRESQKLFNLIIPILCLGKRQTFTSINFLSVYFY
jgi:hypothetical protein